MWQVVLLVYYIVAGQPVVAPDPVLMSKSFGTLDTCTAYLKSDKLADEKADLADQMKARLKKPEIDERGDDPYSEPDTPDPETEITITASCQADNRV